MFRDIWSKSVFFIYIYIYIYICVCVCVCVCVGVSILYRYSLIITRIYNDGHSENCLYKETTPVYAIKKSLKDDTHSHPHTNKQKARAH